MSIIVGIDFGTTNSAVAYYKKNRPEIIENEEGNRITPSCVEVRTGEAVAGRPVSLSAKPEMTVLNIKRIIGKKFSEIQDTLENYSFKIIEDENNNPIIEMYCKNTSNVMTKRRLTPEQISTFILEKVNQAAKNRLETEYSGKAVITVPAYFNNCQREATKRAAQEAGIEVVRLLNEPTAAALAYMHEHQPTDRKLVVIYDFGGGTFDISIIEINNTKIITKAIDGDTTLGGKDIDDRLVKYTQDKIKEQYKFELSSITNPIKKNRTLRRLQNVCEDVKCSLSTAMETEIAVDNFGKIEDISIPLTRSEFEKMNMDIFTKSISILTNCLQKNNIDKSSIDDILMVGGTSRIPKIYELLQEYFGKDRIHKTICPDEAVALGAAVYAKKIFESKNYDLTEVLSFSLGTDVRGNRMSVILSKNTQLPATNTKYYTNSSDQQNTILVKVFEGEDESILNNTYLGVVRIQGFQKSPRGHLRVAVTFEVDLNGILNVTAIEETQGINCNLKFFLNNH